MYYVTGTQLMQILAAIKALPVRADSFDVADAWVGLYLTVQGIANHPAEQKNHGTDETDKGADD